MIMMIDPNSLVRQKEGLKRGGGRSGRLKKGRANRESAARRGQSYGSISISVVGCKE